jgi:hypothetical protein
VPGDSIRRNQSGRPRQASIRTRTRRARLWATASSRPRPGNCRSPDPVALATAVCRGGRRRAAEGCAAAGPAQADSGREGGSDRERHAADDAPGRDAAECAEHGEGAAGQPGDGPPHLAGPPARAHRVTTFKSSRDLEFVRKLRDVVGLYLKRAPPSHARRVPRLP